jgi:hypothetical protein
VSRCDDCERDSYTVELSVLGSNGLSEEEAEDTFWNFEDEQFERPDNALFTVKGAGLSCPLWYLVRLDTADWHHLGPFGDIEPEALMRHVWPFVAQLNRDSRRR